MMFRSFPPDARSCRSKVLSSVVLLLSCIVLMSSPVLARAQSRLPVNDVDLVERTVLELSRLASRDNGDELYDWLSDMSRDQISRTGFTAWLGSPERFVPSADPDILEMSFGPWTWEVTGVTYPNVATVVVNQPGERIGIVITEIVTYRLLNDGGRWRWLFGETAADVDSVVDQPVPTLSYASTFDDPDYADIDAFWARIFGDLDLPYEPVDAIVPVTTLPYSTACGLVTDIDSSGVYLCLLDQTIYFSPALKAGIDDRHGDIGWHTIIAHEWAHQIQTQLGIGYSVDPELDSGRYILELESQADCMTGIYMQDRLASGEVSRQTVQESRTVLAAYGDLRETAWDNTAAHGTGQQRVASFNDGFRNGFVGCELDLDAWNTTP